MDLRNVLAGLMTVSLNSRYARSINNCTIINFMNHIISLKTFFCKFHFLPVKSPASGCCLVFTIFFTNFSLLLLIKVLLIKKRVITFENEVLEAQFKNSFISWKSQILFLRYLIFIFQTISAIAKLWSHDEY